MKRSCPVSTAPGRPVPGISLRVLYANDGSFGHSSDHVSYQLARLSMMNSVQERIGEEGMYDLS